jgi:hypothetical protein
MIKQIIIHKMKIVKIRMLMIIKNKKLSKIIKQKKRNNKKNNKIYNLCKNIKIEKKIK